MIVPARELRKGDQVLLVTLTVGSAMEMDGSVYVQFTENDRVEVLDPDDEVDINREERE